MYIEIKKIIEATITQEVKHVFVQRYYNFI